MAVHWKTVLIVSALSAGVTGLIWIWEPLRGLRTEADGNAQLEILAEQPETRQGKIALAKRLLGLPADAPKGAPWQTYMTRLNQLPADATLDDMKRGQVQRDMRFNRRCAGVPDWSPDGLDSAKEQIEQLVGERVLARRVYGVSLLASKEEFERVSDEKYHEFLKEKARKGGKLEFEDWYAGQIIRAYGLPKGTSTEEAYAAFVHSGRAFGVGGTRKDREAVERQQQREEDLLVLRVNSKVSDADLSRMREAVLKGVQLETPDKPTKFWFWY